MRTAAGGVQTFEFADADLAGVAEAKAGRTVSVCIPCRNEAATVGPIVAQIRSALMKEQEVVDELIVLDDRSGDATAAVAADAGAEVVSIDEVHGQHGPGRGKGNALWATLVVSRGDVVVWCDGDVISFRPDWIVRLLLPLLADDEVGLVKASYRRPTAAGGGGRTTELVARPLLSLYHPALTAVAQPLAGEYAVRRTMVAQLPLVQGWGVEIGLLIDMAEQFGPGSIAQVDLGVREHRHRSLHDLSVQAAEVMATVLARADGSPAATVEPATLTRADGLPLTLNLAERPPLAGFGSPPELLG